MVPLRGTGMHQDGGVAPYGAVDPWSPLLIIVRTSMPQLPTLQAQACPALTVSHCFVVALADATLLHGIPVTGTPYIGNATSPLHSSCFPFGHGNQHRRNKTRTCLSATRCSRCCLLLALLSDCAVARDSEQCYACYIQRHHCRGSAYDCAYGTQSHSP